MIYEQGRNIIKLDLNVTNRCNFRCKHCCFTSGTKRRGEKDCFVREMGEFSFQKIRDLLIEFKSLGGRRIDITGGEPMMRKDIDQIIDLAVNELDIKTEFVTNASLLTPKRLEKFRMLGLANIAISLDGSNYETYSFIRGVDQRTYNKVINNIKASIGLGFYTKINTVVFDSNLNDLVRICKQAVGLGAKEHGFYYFSPIGRGLSSRELVADPLQWLKVIRTELVNFKDQIELSLEVPMIEKALAKKLGVKCYLQDPWHLQILPDGNVYPCAIMAAYQKPLDNLHTGSLAKVWTNPNLWNGKYYQENVEPLIEKFAGCVFYPYYNHLIRSGEYSFVCLCTKYSIEELCGNA
jgi:MoaA/NifB/PqqE/SkfB family radical SAM enzyme